HPFLHAVVALDGAVVVVGGVAAGGAAAVVVDASRLHACSDAGGGTCGNCALQSEPGAAATGAARRAGSGRVALLAALDDSVATDGGFQHSVARGGVGRSIWAGWRVHLDVG